jgi:hypothetical protein
LPPERATAVHVLRLPKEEGLPKDPAGPFVPKFPPEFVLPFIPL